MIDLIMSWFKGYDIPEDILLGVSTILLLLFMIAISIVGNRVAHKVINMIALRFNRLDRFKWNPIFVKRKVFRRLAHIVPVIIIYTFAPTFSDGLTAILQKGASVYLIVIITSIIDGLLKAFDDIYATFEYSKYRPIKGYLQVVKIAVYIVSAIQIIASFMGKNPLLLLSGIGAFSAVLMLVFQDAILGLVAGIQLSANDMMRIGDWIEMPSHNVDGSIIEISLNTVKVENFDRTVTNVPTYAFISNAFKNWRAMTEAGGRRIMRSIIIDISSIEFCSEEMLDRFEKIEYISDYIKEKREEIKRYNEENYIDTSILTNGRHMTNIGVLRVYINNYLERHPHIHKGMTQMVRQLSPGENGLPIEIYAFTNNTAWDQYEGIQSDIFDHILAVIPEFGLRTFQHPTGHDFKDRDFTKASADGKRFKIAGDY